VAVLRFQRTRAANPELIMAMLGRRVDIDHHLSAANLGDVEIGFIKGQRLDHARCSRH